MYSLDLLAAMNAKSKEFLHSSMYQAVKRLVGIKRNASKKSLLQVSLGQPWHCYQQQRSSALIAKLDI